MFNILFEIGKRFSKIDIVLAKTRAVRTEEKNNI